MDIIFSDEHKKRCSKTELCGGELVPPFECAERVEIIYNRCAERRVGDIMPPHNYDDALPLCVHSKGYVDFLATCWAQWQQAGYKGEAIATCWPSRAMPREIVPDDIEGKVGFYALAAETTISGGTYEAALASARVAATAADLLGQGRQSAFALCRPPGHHAARDMFGGYCFFNNVAIAAERLLKGDGNGAGSGLGSAKRVAILDVDFHHGNGTQAIFYERDDVLFVSIHGDPIHAFPYFLGHSDEKGAGAGHGYNFNFPLPPNTAFAVWREALRQGLSCIEKSGADVLLVSLGVDTYKGDPISFFKLNNEDFLLMGGDIAKLKLPTAFVMEGGYAVADIGVNTVNVLEGFLQG